MAKIEVTCDSCGRNIFMTVNQTVQYGGQLFWYGSYACPHYGAQVELDGRDDIPEEVREAILAEQGTWGLNVNESGHGVVYVLKILRGALNLPMDILPDYRRKIPGIVVIGTRAEMERLHWLLSAELLSASVQRITE